MKQRLSACPAFRRRPRSRGASLHSIARNFLLEESSAVLGVGAQVSRAEYAIQLTESLVDTHECTRHISH